MATRQIKPRPHNVRTNKGLRNCLADKVAEMADGDLEGRDASAFAAMARQLAILNREIAAEAAERKAKPKPRATAGPDFSTMNEAQIRAYLDAYDGNSAGGTVVELRPSEAAVSADDDQRLG